MNTPLKADNQNFKITLLINSDSYKEVSNSFINTLDLYKNNKNINILNYSDLNEINKYIATNSKFQNIFIGPIESNYISSLENLCSNNNIFFTFVSNLKYAKDCLYLFNFFPEDDLESLFNYFDTNSRIALLYPEKPYGYYINSIIDKIASKNNGEIVRRASYKDDLSNAKEAIKELKSNQGYGEIDFTHLILAEYGKNLLEISPLLSFYDIDKSNVQLVGTGAWDDEVFFYEPSLQGSIFPGIEINKRINLMKKYKEIYESKPMRIITIMHDILGIIDDLIEKNQNIVSIKNELNSNKYSYNGLDGKVSFVDNRSKRIFDILTISNGYANIKGGEQTTIIIEPQEKPVF